MLVELFQALDYYHWFLFGLALLVLEVFFGGILLLWLGITALLLAGIILFFPGLSWQLQLVLFASGSVFSLITLSRYNKAKKNQLALEKEIAEQENFEGNTYVLQEAVVEGNGRIVINDVEWRIDAGGDSIAGGAMVRVVEQKISTLVVERV